MERTPGGISEEEQASEGASATAWLKQPSHGWELFVYGLWTPGWKRYRFPGLSVLSLRKAGSLKPVFHWHHERESCYCGQESGEEAAQPICLIRTPGSPLCSWGFCFWPQCNNRDQFWPPTWNNKKTDRKPIAIICKALNISWWETEVRESWKTK